MLHAWPEQQASACQRRADEVPSHTRASIVLDGTTILENDLVVTDDRVPGNSKRVMHLYECSECHRTKWSESAPECHGRKMSLKK